MEDVFKLIAEVGLIIIEVWQWDILFSNNSKQMMVM